MTPTCPRCKRVIPVEDVNVATDVAYCRECNLSNSLSGLTHGTELDVDVNRPPAGAWYRSDGAGTVVGATHRSLGTALGVLFFALFWNGIVSVFVLINIAATLQHLGITLPHWFPAPEMNGSAMGVGMTIFLWIFLMPFIVIGLIMISVFLSAIGGRTEIRINGNQGALFSGIGSIGWRRRFETSTIRSVRIEDKSWSDSDGDRQRKTTILLETATGKKFKLGSMLTDERRQFVAAALRRMIGVDR